MEERTEYYRSLDKQAEDKLKQAEDLELSYRERMDSIKKEIVKEETCAAREMKQASDALLKSAQEQAAKLLLDAQEAAMHERTKILDGAQQEIASMAIAATEKLIGQSASNTLDQFLYTVKKE